MKLTDNLDGKIHGRLSIKSIDNNTGNIIDSFEDPNVIVLDAKQIVIQSISRSTNTYYLDRIKIGDDVGTGTPDVPETAVETYDENTMSIIYSGGTPLTVGYSGNSVTFNITINGADVMTGYPAETSKVINSAALHSVAGDVFAYRRFPQKSISNVIDLSIAWTIYY